MTKLERKFFDGAQKYVLWIVLFAVTAMGLMLRFCGRDFLSGDYRSFLLPWWNKIDKAGLAGLGTQVGNYNIPYQILIYLFTLLPFGPLYSYKLLSVVFDLVLAGSAALVVNSFSEKKSPLRAVMTYCIVFCSLTVVFNSAFWAQCDSIYTAFILLAIYFLRKEKHILSFVMLGAAFAFKLQFIFILPVFLYYYATTRKLSILHFLIIPAVNILLCLPAICMGRGIGDTFAIYLEQTDYGKLIQMNFPSLFAFMCNGKDTTYYYLFKSFSIFFTVTVLGMGLGLVMYKKTDLTKPKTFLLAAIWTVFTCLMFLSSMHERYSYLLDILLILYVVISAKHVWLAVACNLVSLRGYCYYLFKFEAFDLKTASILYIALYAYTTYLFVKEVAVEKKDSEWKLL